MMRIWLNDSPIDLLPGMTVRHALLQAGLLGEVEQGLCRVVDEWENEVGLDGALEDGRRFVLKPAR
ncbi:MAG: hypothetical protein HY787_04890 [Deltaproteobacteria bacterium]|nr:hypothetical protein [Deltaproteobacteria bacterium]